MQLTLTNGGMIVTGTKREICDVLFGPAASEADQIRLHIRQCMSSRRVGWAMAEAFPRQRARHMANISRLRAQVREWVAMIRALERTA